MLIMEKEISQDRGSQTGGRGPQHIQKCSLKLTGQSNVPHQLIYMTSAVVFQQKLYINRFCSPYIKETIPLLLTLTARFTVHLQSDVYNSTVLMEGFLKHNESSSISTSTNKHPLTKRYKNLD